MITCPQCGTQNEDGAMFCDNCGAPVSAGGIAPQPAVQPQYQPPIGGQPRMVVQASGAQIALPPGKVEYLIGREDPVSNSFPEVDLTPHGGDEGGVSRSHARLYQQGGQWYLQDLNAVNFTFVNNQKVLPNAPVPVPNGAGLRFGRVKVTFYTQ